MINLSEFESSNSRSKDVKRNKKERVKSNKDDFYRLDSDLSDFKSNQKKQKKPVKGDNAYNSAVSYVSGRLKEYYKDALEQNHVIAYALGHLANDLVINVWNTYSTWYLN